MFFVPWRPPEDSRPCLSPGASLSGVPRAGEGSLPHLLCEDAWKQTGVFQVRTKNKKLVTSLLTWEGFGFGEKFERTKERFALKPCFILLCSFHKASLIPYGFAQRPTLLAAWISVSWSLLPSGDPGAGEDGPPRRPLTSSWLYRTSHGGSFKN